MKDNRLTKKEVFILRRKRAKRIRQAKMIVIGLFSTGFVLSASLLTTAANNKETISYNQAMVVETKAPKYDYKEVEVTVNWGQNVYDLQQELAPNNNDINGLLNRAIKLTGNEVARNRGGFNRVWMGDKVTLFEEMLIEE